MRRLIRQRRREQLDPVLEGEARPSARFHGAVASACIPTETSPLAQTPAATRARCRSGGAHPDHRARNDQSASRRVTSRCFCAYASVSVGKRQHACEGRSPEALRAVVRTPASSRRSGSAETLPLVLAVDFSFRAAPGAGGHHRCAARAYAGDDFLRVDAL